MTPYEQKKIRILYLIDSLLVGGAELVLYNLCRGLTSSCSDRFEITIAYFHNTKPSLFEKMEALGISTVNLNCTNKRFFISIWRTIRLIKKLKPDMVHTHLFISDRYGQIAAFLCGVRLRFSTIHNMELQLSFKERLTIHLIKYLSTGIIAVSASAKKHYVLTYGFPTHKINVIYNASGHQNPVPENRIPVPPRPPFKIVNLDNLKTSKGQLFLISAMKELVQLEPSIHLDIIGHTISEYAQSVAAEVRTHQLESNVSIIGYISDPFSILSEYHLMLSLSLWEGFHMSLVEGMSIGLPIITTPIAPHIELLEGTNAPFVRHDDSVGIAQKVLAVLTDYTLYSSLSKANIARSTAFSRDTMVKKYIDYYSKMSI